MQAIFDESLVFFFQEVNICFGCSKGNGMPAFVEFLRAKTDKGLEGMMDAIIEENYDALRELGK